VIPMMQVKGVSGDEVHAMLVGNPGRFLQFA